MASAINARASRAFMATRVSLPDAEDRTVWLHDRGRCLLQAIRGRGSSPNFLRSPAARDTRALAGAGSGDVRVHDEGMASHHARWHESNVSTPSPRVR